MRRGDIAEGPGVNDMKGGLVIMLGALRAMKAAGTLKDADITIVLTGDEERAGRPLDVSRADLINAAKASDLALEFEGLAQENGKDMASIARRSATEWKLSVQGQVGPLFGDLQRQRRLWRGLRAGADCRPVPPAGARAERHLQRRLHGRGRDGGVERQRDRGDAGGKTNIIPAEAVARGDLRTLSNAQTASIRAKMQAIVAQPLTGASARSIEFGGGLSGHGPQRRLPGPAGQAQRGEPGPRALSRWLSWTP